MIRRNDIQSNLTDKQSNNPQFPQQFGESQILNDKFQIKKNNSESYHNINEPEKVINDNNQFSTSKNAEYSQNRFCSEHDKMGNVNFNKKTEFSRDIEEKGGNNEYYDYNIKYENIVNEKNPLGRRIDHEGHSASHRMNQDSKNINVSYNQKIPYEQNEKPIESKDHKDDLLSYNSDHNYKSTQKLSSQKNDSSYGYKSDDEFQSNQQKDKLYNYLTTSANQSTDNYSMEQKNIINERNYSAYELLEPHNQYKPMHESRDYMSNNNSHPLAGHFNIPTHNQSFDTHLNASQKSFYEPTFVYDSVTDQPLYVNVKQFNYIRKRKVRRDFLDSLMKQNKQNGYLHESRHRHAMNRRRAPSGRFLTKAETEALKQQEKQQFD